MLAMQADGVVIPPDAVASIHRKLALYGDSFLKPAGKIAREQGSSPAESQYYKRWCHADTPRIELPAIFAEIKAADLHAAMYEEASQWIHSTIRAIKQVTHFEDHVSGWSAIGLQPALLSETARPVHRDFELLMVLPEPELPQPVQQPETAVQREEGHLNGEERMLEGAHVLLHAMIAVWPDRRATISPWHSLPKSSTKRRSRGCSRS
jgi:hypothetical protein